jgi:hypothetical protein
VIAASFLASTLFVLALLTLLLVVPTIHSPSPRPRLTRSLLNHFTAHHASRQRLWYRTLYRSL